MANRKHAQKIRNNETEEVKLNMTYTKQHSGQKLRHTNLTETKGKDTQKLRDNYRDWAWRNQTETTEW